MAMPARCDFAVDFGGGLRLRVNKRVVFRGEAQAYRSTGPFAEVPGNVEGRLSFQVQ